MRRRVESETEKLVLSLYKIMICGNVNSCRTEAEIELQRMDGEPLLVGLVYETDNGWQQEAIEKVHIAANDKDFAAAAAEARRCLEEYINRRGENPPEGLTNSGLSFWLMKKKDGTSMGRAYQTGNANPDK